MGFERVVYKLDLSDTRWVGLEVLARGTTMDESIELQHFLDMGSEILKRGDPVAEEGRQRYFTLLAEIVVDWNRTDGGEAVPVTPKHMALEEMSMLQAMTRAYLRSVFTVAPPLSQPSSDGEPSEEQFQLMDQLSESPPS